MAFTGEAALARSNAIEISMQSQPLEKALNEFSRISGVDILFSPQLVRGRTAPAIHGRMSAIEAVRRMVRDLPIDVVDNGAGSLVLRAASPEQSSRARAEKPQSSTEQPDPEVVVVGTRRTDRTVTQSASPIDVFDRKAVEGQTSFDMNDMLRNLVPSFNVARWAVNDGSTFVRPPSLRGLPPDEILVMVNGKRRHRAAVVHYANGAQGVDMAMIPGIAVERIELLRDSAAAQYGSDAIAGVINYQLKRNNSGLQIRSRYGQFYEGDGKAYQVAANLGMKLTEAGFFDISAEFADNGRTTRSVTRPGALALAQQFPDTYGQIPNPVQRWGNPKSRAARGFFNAGLDLSDHLKAYMFGSYGHSEFDSDFNYRQPVSVTGPNAQGVPNGQTFGQSGGVYSTIYTDIIPGLYDSRGKPVFDGTGKTFNFRQIYPLGFTPLFHGDLDDMSLVAGAKGDVGDLTWDVSAAYGENRIKYSLTNSMNPSMGPKSPTSFYMGQLKQHETNFNADFTYKLDAGLSSPVTLAFGGEYRREGYAIGLGDPESYEIGIYGVQTVRAADGTLYTNTPLQIGSNGFPGYGPDSVVNAARGNYAFYGEVDADVVRGLSLTGALRHERFDDFGTTTTWKATARYAFNDAIAIRGGLGTGFRAPTPGQLFAQNVTASFVGNDPIESAIYPVTTPAARAFGAKPLKPEKSRNFSAGIVLTPARALTFTVDYYNIRVRDRIGLTGFIDINTPERRQALRDSGARNAETLGRLRYFTNAFATKTEGVDVVGNWRAGTGIGDFDTTLAVSYNTTQVTSTEPTLVLGQPINVVDSIRVGNINKGLPHWRGYATENWSLGSFSATARANYYDGWTVVDYAGNGGDKRFSSDVTVDLEVRYKANSWLTLAVGAENILDNYPDKDRRATGTAQQNWYQSTGGTAIGMVYPDGAPYGYNGGFWYLRANFDF